MLVDVTLPWFTGGSKKVPITSPSFVYEAVALIKNDPNPIPVTGKMIKKRINFE